MTPEPPDNTSTKLLDGLIEQALDRRARSGGDGGSGDFDARLARVEKWLDDIGGTVSRLEAKGGQLLKEGYELKGRVSQLPSLWQLFLPLMAFVVAIFGLAFAFVRFAIPHA